MRRCPVLALSVQQATVKVAKGHGECGFAWGHLPTVLAITLIAFVALLQPAWKAR